MTGTPPKRVRGQPPKPEHERATVPLSVRLRQEDADRLERLIERTTDSKGQVIRDSLEAYEEQLDREEPL